MWVCISYACGYVSCMYAYMYVSLYMHALYYRYVHTFVFYLYVFIYSDICLLIWSYLVSIHGCNDMVMFS